MDDMLEAMAFNNGLLFAADSMAAAVVSFAAVPRVPDAVYLHGKCM
jgi:hypothetical protein